MSWDQWRRGFLAVSTLCVGLGLAGAAEPQENEMQRQQWHKAFQAGNYRDAYEGFRKLALDPNDNPLKVGEDLRMGVQALQQLNRTNETDPFIEAVIAAHKANWRLLSAAAEVYLGLPHQGFMIAGKFERGPHRGGGQMVNSLDRDRVRAMQLMAQAIPLAQQDPQRREVAALFLSVSRLLLAGRGQREAWQLQYLTDLNVLPDYEPGWGYYMPSRGAPVDEQGNPVFHTVPNSWDDAASDGQRWRWCLVQAMEFDAGRMQEVRMELANFLHEQFGVQTMAEYGWFFGRGITDDTRDDQSGTYALHTLKETETIARLATGIKRFDLPEEFNFIKIYQQVAEEDKGGYGLSALERLASIFENRRQYPRAAEYWGKAIQRAEGSPQQGHYKERLQQIIGAWGRFEPILTQPAGQGATVEYRFRNGTAVELSAHEILVEKLLDDVKAYIKSRPAQLQWEKLNISDLGYRLIHNNQKEYVGRQVASWKLDLQPREKHFDKRVTITTPLQKPGAYLLTAKMVGGNTSHIIVWLADTAIAKKPLDGKTYYFVADAVTGRPVARANVEFFGWRQEHRDARRYEIFTKQFAEYSDADGQVILDPASQPEGYQWLVTARTQQGRLAYLGFSGVWHGRRYDAEYNQIKVFTITDRPVYRPGQTVHYKFWVRHARYDQEGSEFGGQPFTVEFHNPKGERILQETVTADAYGGIAGKFELPADAMLGVYRVGIAGRGGGAFRVEEYKKPEFEVTIEASEEPVMLGEKVQATIKAQYYFGAPVTQAKVKYKVLRTSYTERWYPIAPWDWLYGPGYWWFAYDYEWYPGWREWGCRRPFLFWIPRPHQPPEVVADREVEIGPDGQVKVEIDTGVAKALHPDQDHSYAITAEVVDQSRRTIVGTGTVLVARKPFTVTAWVDRGYYRVGDVVHAHFAARRLDGKPVAGAGKLSILQISYKEGKPVEKPVYQTDLPTNEEGFAQMQLRASRAGQYRLSYKLTDAKGHTIEGGYLFTIIGAGFDSSQFRFNSLELVPEKREYQPGETVKLMINTDRADSTVLLFVRPANGVYLPPAVLRLDGKSTVQEIAVVQKDMPNFFIEAMTVADGRVSTECREIVVPPEKRVLSVEVVPSSSTYRPGQKAQVKLKLADFHGKPFVGSAVVAIYDKSVEYISGGTNVPEIKAFFWKWRRHHHPQTETNLGRRSGNIIPPGTVGMQDVGVFGATSVDELAAMEPGVGFGRGGLGGAAELRRAETFAREGANGMAVRMLPAPGVPMAEKQAPPEGGAAAALVQPTVRKEFADTALWVGALTTDQDGTAEVSLNMPENLTTWRIKVWGMGHGTRVGEGQTDVVTRKDLIVRLQAPRFFVQKDEVLLSANVHNYLKTEKKVQVVLELEGDVLQPMDPLSRTAQIAPNKEARIDWRVRVLDEGQAVVRMKALTDEESDAMEMRFPCYVHGMLKMEARSGVIRPEDASGKMSFRVPAQRRPKQSRLEVRYSPTLAGAMVDALPYLVDYPYGCTEQTLNRFLPTVITQKILLDMRLDLEDIQKKRINLNPQEIGEDTERARQWKRWDRNPVFDQQEVRRMVQEGVQRLTEMQLSDGGWGWFSGFGEHSSPHTTALVVHGLQIAQRNDVALVPGMLQRGIEWLKRYQEGEVQKLKNALMDPKKEPWKASADNIDAFVYMVLVDAGLKDADMHEFLYRDRTKLAVYALALYGLAVEKLGDKEKLDMILRNISQYLQQDDENQTAWLNLPESNWWWCWYGSEFEAQAYYLKLLARTDPHGETARRLVKYLLNNRKHATYWNSTRDTAICVEAMADFLRASGEERPEMTVEVWLDGQLQKAVEVTPATLFSFDNKFVLEGEAVREGDRLVELRKRGRGPVYFNGYLTNFTLEDPITKAGLEIQVQRKYYRLKKADKSIKAVGARGQVVEQKVEKYQREPLADLAMLKSGELVEIELEIASKNDYEYIVFEDMKPAGFEPVDLRSGYVPNPLGAYIEFRDNRVVFFVSRLARGNHSVSYRMRAEIPGRFSALPTRAWAMYAPELKANSDEIKLQVED
ncbi:MAG: alpha-2-macroglobulin family protein [Thermoguttaceae bacterium]